MANVQKVTNTLVVDNFGGPLTRKITGNINSGFANFEASFGYDPFTKPGVLAFLEQPTSILTLTTTDGPITGLRTLADGATINVYGITEKTAKVYKIQANNVSPNDPQYDTPSIISAFMQGEDYNFSCAIVPYGASIAGAKRLYVGGDDGVSRVYTTGASPSMVGAVASYNSGVPRPLAVFLGKLYFGNKNNIGEIDSTETVTTYNKLNPGLPDDYIVRDLDVTPDGNYLQITVSKTNQMQLDALAFPTIPSGNEETFKVFWNGTDSTYTAYESYNGYSLTSNTVFGSKNFTTGYDLGGAALYDGQQKILSFPKALSPNFGAMFSIGNLLGFANTDYDTSTGFFRGNLYFYGRYDTETPNGLYRFLRFNSGQGTDVNIIPACTPVTNSFYNYLNDAVTVAKVYISASESKNPAGTTFYGPLYKFNVVPTGSVAALGGIYQTQTQMFSKKVLVSEVRVYGEPWVDNNAFKVDLIGSNQSSIIGASYTFSVPNSSTLTVGNDYAWYNPNHAPTYALGLKITNIGSVSPTIHKVEIDYSIGGK